MRYLLGSFFRMTKMLFAGDIQDVACRPRVIEPSEESGMKEGASGLELVLKG